MSKLLPSEKEVLLWQDKSEKAVLARLDKHYKDALKDIEEKISSMLGRNDANLPHVIRRIEYQRMLKEQIQTVLERLHSNEYETISKYLTDSYTDAFVGTVYTLHEQDVPLILPIDQSVVMKAVTLDSKLKETLYTTMGKDMTALKKTVAAEVTRGIATGQMYSEIARNIRYAAGIPLRRAKTIARTEASRVQEQATFDAAQEAKASGADVVKQWSSRRDGKTRDTHRMLDGQVREVNEAFTVNGKKAMHPHGFGVAELDINCRCTMLTRARAALDEDTLKQLEERAQKHGLLAKDSKKLGKAQAKNISQFKERYLKVAETLENTGKSGIMILDLQLFANGKQRAEKYAANWPKASLDKVVNRLVPGAKASAESESGKITYSSETSNYSIIYDVAGDYFRIEDKRLVGKRRYVDLDGNDVANITENGKTRGRTKDEYHQLTHIKNDQEKED